MSNQHVISLDRAANLSMDTGRLKIEFSAIGETRFIAACDIAVLILAHPCIRLSIGVLRELAQNGAVIVTAGEKYTPCAISLPLGVNADGARRPHLQAKYAGLQEPGIWWAQLVRAKILGQARAAELFDPDLAARLRLIAKQVEPGDATCCEAHAAQVYWDGFFAQFNNTAGFRDKQGAVDPVNVTLNYGYAVLRAIIARSLVAAGLCLNLGVGHSRKDNPFNLADDFIEPFRFLVDGLVWRIFKEEGADQFDKEVKNRLLSSLLKNTVEIAGKEYRLFFGIDCAVNSFCLSLEDSRRKLLLPNQPARPGKTPSASLWQAIQFQDETQ